MNFDTLMSSLMLILCVVAVPATVVMHLRQSRRNSQKLIKHFNGALNFPWGSFLFKYKGVSFTLEKSVKCRGGDGSLRWNSQLPVIRFETDISHLFFVGNPKCKEYQHVGWLQWPTTMIEVGPKRYLVGTSNQSSLVDVRSKLESIDTGMIFEKEWASLRVSDETSIKGVTLEKKQEASFLGLTDEIYEHPEKLEPFLDVLIEISDSFARDLAA